MDQSLLQEVVAQFGRLPRVESVLVALLQNIDKSSDTVSANTRKLKGKTSTRQHIGLQNSQITYIICAQWHKWSHITTKECCTLCTVGIVKYTVNTKRKMYILYVEHI